MLAVLMAFVFGFSWYSWQAEKAYLTREQESALEFTARFMNSALQRTENGLLRFGLELTRGGGNLSLDQEVERAIPLLHGYKIRVRDLLHVQLRQQDGRVLASTDMPLNQKDKPIAGNGHADRQRHRNATNEAPPLPSGETSDHDKKQDILVQYWNADLKENYRITIDQPEERWDSAPFTMVLRHDIERARHKPARTLIAVLKLGLLEEYWETRTTAFADAAFMLVADNGISVNLFPAIPRKQYEALGNLSTTAGLFTHLQHEHFPLKGTIEAELGHAEKSLQLISFRRLDSYPYSLLLAIPKGIVWEHWWQRVKVPFLLSFLLLVLGLISYRTVVRNQITKEKEQLRIQEMLRLNQERWKFALECAGEGMWEIDCRNQDFQVSRRPLEILGYEDSGDISSGKLWKSRIHPEDYHRVEGALQAFSAGETADLRLEHRMISRDGLEMWFAFRGNAISHDDSGKPINIYGTLIDITRRKKELLELEEREERLRHGFQFLPTGVAMLSNEYTVVEANAAFSRMFGYGDKEIVGLDVACLLFDDGSIRSLDEERPREMRLAEGISQELMAIRRNGERFPIICTLSEVCGVKDRNTHFVVRVEDLSELKKTQSQDVAKEILITQEKDRAQLSRELHDEVGQALTALRLRLRLAQQSPEDKEQASGHIEDSQRILDGLAESIRGIANRMRPTALDQLGLVSAIRSHLSKSVRPLGMNVILNENLGEKRLPSNLELCCFRVAQEALTNCIRHANTLRAEVSLTGTGGKLVLSIKDNGIGFDISQYYSSQDASRSLGLIGMHERVSACGGELQIRSAPGAGTEVMATFNMHGEPQW